MPEAVTVQEERRRQAVLLLVQKLRDEMDDSTSTAALTPSTPRPQSYVQLCDGYALYAILHRIAPDIFADMSEMAAPSHSESVAAAASPPSMSWVVRKANLLTLIRRMNEYAHATLGPARSFDFTRMLHAEAIARSSILQQQLLHSGTEDANIGNSTSHNDAVHADQNSRDNNSNSRSNGNDNDSISSAENSLLSDDVGVRDFASLTDVFVLIVVLSGAPQVMRVVKKSLPREVQVVLSNIAKAVMMKYELRPMRRYETPARMGSVTRTREPAVTASAGTISTTTRAGAAMNVPSLIDTNSALSNANPHSPMDAAAVTSTRSRASALAVTTRAASHSHSDALVPMTEDNTTVEEVSLASSPVHSNAAIGASSVSLLSLPSASSSSSLAAAAAAAALGTSRGVEPLVADESYYRNATLQLRRELADVHGRVGELELQLRLATQEGQTWEAKYRHLLQSHEGESGMMAGALGSSSFSAAASAGTVGAAIHAIGEDAALLLLRQRLAQREDTIARLSQRIEEQASRLSEFKEATTAQEAVLKLMRRKLKQVEEDVVRQAAARREASDKFAVAEDKLAIAAKIRAELESTVEQVQSELRVLQLTQQDRGNTGGGGGSEEPGALLRNASFTSNGSIDRVMQLENELDEVRAARDVAQRQLHILQRQVSIMPAPVADATAAADTWKAQVRLLTAERDELRRANQDALQRLQSLQNGDTSNFTSDKDSSNNSPDGGAGRGGHDTSNRNGDADAVQRERAILSSLLLQYGYHNLLLRQHTVLLHQDSGANEAGPLGCAAYVQPATGSILTRQRHRIEMGLLESVIHNRSQQKSTTR